MFTTSEFEFIDSQVAMLRTVAAKYALMNPELAEECERKAKLFDAIARKIERLIAAINV